MSAIFSAKLLRNIDEARNVAFRIFMMLWLVAQTGVLFAANAKVIGGEDTRELIGPYDTDHSVAVGQVHCEKVVVENGKRMIYTNISTGTLVGNTKTIVTTSHGFFNIDNTGKIAQSYDYLDDCEYRKYSENGKDYDPYDFVYAESGGYQEPGDDRSDDWMVLQLKERVRGGKHLIARDINQDIIKTDSRFPIQIIAHAHDKGTDGGLFFSEGIIRAVITNGVKQFAHTADTSGRASGAVMVFIDSKGERAAYGIHTSNFHDHDLNRFIPFDSRILDALRSVMRHDSKST